MDMDEFFVGLRSAVAEGATYDEKRQFKARYAGFLGELMVCFDRIGLIGSVDLHPSPPPSCDLCGADLDKLGLFFDAESNVGAANVTGPDGVVRNVGQWADMCCPCFMKHGAGIGYGGGQVYVKKQGDEWHCIAGGPPLSSTDD